MGTKYMLLKRQKSEAKCTNSALHAHLLVALGQGQLVDSYALTKKYLDRLVQKYHQKSERWIPEPTLTSFSIQT